jgi:hypothetical protein
VSEDPDSSGFYFRGESSLYISSDHRSYNKAYKEAVSRAFAEVSSFFGLAIASNLEIKKVTTQDISLTDAKSTIKTASNHLILDMKPEQTYQRFSDSKEHFSIIVLLKLDKKTKERIEKEAKADKAKLAALKTQILEYIDKKDFYRANNSLEIALGMRAATTDDTLPQLKKQVLALMDKALISTIFLSKKSYLPNEAMRANITLNNDAYVYVLYEGCGDTELLFPNQYQKKNKISKGAALHFPNDDISLMAYEEFLDCNKTAIRVVASKSYLPVMKYAIDEIDGVSLLAADTPFEADIKRCVDQALCSDNRQKFMIEKAKQKIRMRVRFHGHKKMRKRLHKYLKRHGITGDKSHLDAHFHIHKIKKYSKMLQRHVSSFQVDSNITRGKKLLCKHRRQLNESEIDDYIVNYLKEQDKKLSHE